MIVSQLTVNVIPPLKLHDTAQTAFDRMNEFRVSHLPIVNGRVYMGLISDRALVELPQFTEPIESLSFAFSNLSVYGNQHVYDVVRLVSEQGLSLVPVVDRENNYDGLVSQSALLEYFGKVVSADKYGGIVVLELSLRGYSLTEVARVVEAEGAKVLHCSLTASDDPAKLELTLKLDKSDLTAIVASLRRFNYVVQASFSQETGQSDNLERFDAFMKYLNM